MAISNFKEPIPGSEPQEDFKKYFFDGMFKPNIFCDWVVRNGTRVGFVIFGIEDHLFLPRKTGFFYAFYIVPEARKGPVASLVMQECCRGLDTYHPSKIQLEVIEGNEEANTICTWVGFLRVSSNYYLPDRTFCKPLPPTPTLKAIP